MKHITRRSVALAVTLMLTLATLGMSAPKSERSNKHLTIYGCVVQMNESDRTLLVSDYWSKKLYLVNVPKGETFQITFGMNMKTTEPEIRDVHRNDRVRIRCIRGEQEHLARIDDGREVVALTADN